MPHLCPSPYIATTLDKVNEHLVFNMYSIFSTKHNPRNFCINMNVTNCQATKFTMKKMYAKDDKLFWLHYVLRIDTHLIFDCGYNVQLNSKIHITIWYIINKTQKELIRFMFSKYMMLWIAILLTYLFIISVNVIQACMMQPMWYENHYHFSKVAKNLSPFIRKDEFFVGAYHITILCRNMIYSLYQFPRGREFWHLVIGGQYIRLIIVYQIDDVVNIIIISNKH